MKRLNKVVSAITISLMIAMSVSSINAGVIVNLKADGEAKKCYDKGIDSNMSKLDTGVIVNLTGVIVNLTGVIVNLTGVIVNYSEPDASDCGYIPTSD